MTTATFSQLPAAGPITGAEIIPVMQNGVTSQSTVADVAAGGVASLPLGAQNLSIKSANFANTVARAPLIANYQFGSSAPSQTGITAIRNFTDLANNFNPLEDFTAGTTINSEIERFQPFNAVNHVFNANNLTLQGVNPNNDWQCSTISQTTGFTPGAATPIAALGLADTSKVQLGQVACVQGGGGVGGSYYVTAIIVNVSVTLTTLSGPSPQTSTGLIFWMPIVGVALSSPCIVGATTMNFAAVPSFVQVGMQIAWLNVPINGLIYNRDQDYRVTNISGNVVTFSPPRGNVSNLSAGVITWFQPTVTSGQIWSQLQLDLTNPQTFFAIEGDLTLVPNWAPIRTNNLGPNGQWTLAAFNALPASTPLGWWGAFWGFSADDGNASSETSSASEIDMLELQICGTQDISCINTGAVSYTGSATIMQKNDSGWSTGLGFGISNKTDGTNFVGRHLYQFIFANGMEYRFFDGVLYKVREFQWTGQRPFQFSVGLALGAINVSAASNTIFPNNPSSFPLMQLAINGIKVWYQAP